MRHRHVQRAALHEIAQLADAFSGCPDVAASQAELGQSVGINNVEGTGEVLVSSIVRDLVAGSGMTFEDCGLYALKGVPGEWRILAVTSPGAVGRMDEADAA